jgi:hypothetical protein
VEREKEKGGSKKGQFKNMKDDGEPSKGVAKESIRMKIELIKR